jgi:perosamine synthetase
VSILFQSLCLTIFLNPRLFRLPASIPSLKLGATLYDPSFKIRKMSPFQAGLARDWHSRLQELNRVRRENSLYFSTAIAGKYRHFCTAKNGSHPNPIRYPIRIDDAGAKERLLKSSKRKGLGMMPSYPAPVNSIPELKQYFEYQNFPAASRLASGLITLPVHSYVTQRDRREIEELIATN